jgi:hypothetical protein
MWFCRYHFYKTQGKQKYMDLEAFLQVNVIDQISKMYAVSFFRKRRGTKKGPNIYKLRVEAAGLRWALRYLDQVLLVLHILFVLL